MNNEQFIHNFCNGAYLNDNKSYRNLNVSATRYNELKSYNTVIARLMGNAIFICTNNYSNTTAKHLNKVKYASNHLNQVYCSRLPQNSYNDDQLFIRQVIEQIIKDRESLIEQIAKARKPEKHLNDFESIMISLQHIKPLLADSEQLSAIDSLLLVDFDSLLSSDKLKEAKERLKAKKLADKELERLRKLEASKLLELWVLGHDIHSFQFHRLKSLPCKLRIKERPFCDLELSDKLETSHGVSVDLLEAKKAYQLAKQTSYDNLIGQKISHFKIDRFENNELVIGCHKIDIAEIERVLG